MPVPVPVPLPQVASIVFRQSGPSVALRLAPLFFFHSTAQLMEGREPAPRVYALAAGEIGIPVTGRCLIILPFSSSVDRAISCFSA